MAGACFYFGKMKASVPRIKFFHLYMKTNPVGSENRWVFLYMLSSQVTCSGSFSAPGLCNPTLNMFSCSLRWQAHESCWEHCAEGPLFDPIAIMRRALKWDLSASKMDQSDAFYLWGNVASYFVEGKGFTERLCCLDQGSPTSRLRTGYLLSDQPLL